MKPHEKILTKEEIMIEEKNILCIYHGNCADGFGAAWTVWKRFPEAKFHAGVYGQNPPDVKGKDVVIVDFSYKKDILEDMRKDARSIIILDHHKSAAEDLANSKQFSKNWDQHCQNVYQDMCENADVNGAILYSLFDMNRSGAMIAWDFFHPDKEPPRLIEHIQDRDLWLFKIKRTREIQANLFSYPYDFEVWDDLMFRLNDDDEHISFSCAGAAIERKHHKDVSELIEVTKTIMNIGGHLVWCANIPYTMASDACHLMCNQPMSFPSHVLSPADRTDVLPEFAACYYDKRDCRVFSLRSIGDFDVSEIAKKYGGGGHRNAAGFSVHNGFSGWTLDQQNIQAIAFERGDV